MEKIESLETLAELVLDDYYKNKSKGVLSNLTRKNTSELSVSKESVLADLRENLSQYQNEDGTSLTEEQQEEVLKFIEKDMWGYGICDELIHDKDISDIKLYGANNIRMKKIGKRYPTNITFRDNLLYQVFVNRILERNKVNLGTANAIQTFTDRSQEDFTLRITAMSGLLTDSELPCIAIRKIAKEKMDLEMLFDAGMFDFAYEKLEEVYKNKLYGESFYEQEIYAGIDPKLNSLFLDLIASRGILFTGKGASGKTSFMNALIAHIPHDESVMLCQENMELFDDDHPDLLGTHVLSNGADSKISYTLGDLTKAALLMDLDRVIVGEVKEGTEAAGLSKASMTGHKCWTSVHGESCEMAVDKMADYISQATGYSVRDSMKQLMGFEYVVHMASCFKVDEIKRIKAWDKERDVMVFETVYPFKEACDA